MENYQLSPSTALRWLHDEYDSIQRLRVETGERIRAVAQGRDEPARADEVDPDADTDALLVSIRTGETDGPVPFMGQSYRRYWQAEREVFRAMSGILVDHPAWLWMEGVKGIGPTLGCKILGQLRIEKAHNASSFWKFSGLHTVPGNRRRCPVCEMVRLDPWYTKVSAEHTTGGKKCKGKLEIIAGPEDNVYAAPRPQKGERLPYNKRLRKTMWLVARQMIMAGGPYADLYRQAKAKYIENRPGWTLGHSDGAARRYIQKIFLSHLYEEWCLATGREPVPAYAIALLGHEGELKSHDFSTSGVVV